MIFSLWLKVHYINYGSTNNILTVVEKNDINYGLTHKISTMVNNTRYEFRFKTHDINYCMRLHKEHFL